MHKTWVFSILFLIWFEGCVIYGPKAEHKSNLDYLNGQNYDNGPDGTASRVIVPVLKTKVRESSVSGEVLLGSSLAEMPLRGVRLELLEATAAPSATTPPTATTDADGTFKFTGELKNGGYIIRVRSDQYEGEAPIEISSYETKGIVIHAKRKSL